MELNNNTIETIEQLAEILRNRLGQIEIGDPYYDRGYIVTIEDDVAELDAQYNGELSAMFDDMDWYDKESLKYLLRPCLSNLLAESNKRYTDYLEGGLEWEHDDISCDWIFDNISWKDGIIKYVLIGNRKDWRIEDIKEHDMDIEPEVLAERLIDKVERMAVELPVQTDYKGRPIVVFPLESLSEDERELLKETYSYDEEKELENRYGSVVRWHLFNQWFDIPFYGRTFKNGLVCDADKTDWYKFTWSGVIRLTDPCKIDPYPDND